MEKEQGDMRQYIANLVLAIEQLPEANRCYILLFVIHG